MARDTNHINYETKKFIAVINDHILDKNLAM